MAGRVPALRALRDRLFSGGPRPRPHGWLSRRAGRLLVVVGFLGPGLIAANAGNDAGGIATYSAVGARYGYDLSVLESRTTATLVLCAVGLWVLVLQARPFNWWKTVLVASMVGAVALIMVVPAFRDFYAVQLPPAEVLGEAALVAGVAIVLLEVGWRFSRVIGNRRHPHEIVDDNPTDEEALARASSSS